MKFGISVHCAPLGGFGINPRLDAATLRVLAASKEDSRPQAIVKFQTRNSFDYRVRYEPQLKIGIFEKLSKNC